MTEAVAAQPARRGPARDRFLALRLAGLVLLAASLVGIVLVIIGSGAPGPATGAATVVPADALAYVNVSLDGSRPSVSQALRVTGRLPDFPIGLLAAENRLGAILSGGKTVDFGSQIDPWLGDEASLALLNTASSTAGSLIILDVRNPVQARAFLHRQGAVTSTRYRGTTLFAYPTGNELAFVSHYLVAGQDASVRSAVDVAAGSTRSLADSGVYQRATAQEPDDRVLDAYASLAGLQRVLAPRGGVIGAFGDLLSQPAVQGVSASISPGSGGARVQIHSVLDPTLARFSRAGAPFTPTLQHVIPAGATMMLDVRGLNRAAPPILSAGATAGVEGGIGPLLARLGAALKAEGVDVHSLTSIFTGETAVALVPNGAAPTIVVVARTPNPAQTQAQLAELEIPLAQLFQPPRSGPGRVPVFNDRTVAGITAHQLALANGLQLNYSVFRGLVVVSTSLAGVAAVAQHNHSLAEDPGFRKALSGRPDPLTSLLYANVRQLLGLSAQTGLTSSATYQRVGSDLQAIGPVGLTSTRSGPDSDTQISIRLP